MPSLWAWQNRHYYSEAPLTANSYWILFYSDIGFCVHFPCCLAVTLHCQRIARTEPLLFDVARLKTQEKNSKNWRAIGWLSARYEMVQKKKSFHSKMRNFTKPDMRMTSMLLSVLPETLCSQQSTRPVVREPNLAEFLRDDWSFPDGFIREKTFKHWTTVAILLIWDTLNLMLDSDLQSEWDRWGDAFQALHKGACQKWAVFQFKRLFLTWFFYLFFYLRDSSNSFVTCLAERQTFRTINRTDLSRSTRNHSEQVWSHPAPFTKAPCAFWDLGSFKTLLITYKALSAVTLLYVSDLLSPRGPARVQRSSGMQPFICFRLQTERTEEDGAFEMRASRLRNTRPGEVEQAERSQGVSEITNEKVQL